MLVIFTIVLAVMLAVIGQLILVPLLEAFGAQGRVA